MYLMDDLLAVRISAMKKCRVAKILETKKLIFIEISNFL